MTFNTPNINDILTTLIGNNMLVSALKENGALITKETLLNQKGVLEFKEEKESNSTPRKTKKENKAEIKENKIFKRQSKLYNYNDYKLFDDYVLNNMEYNDALEYDKRKYCEYYISLLKTKHILIFSFYTSNDYNSKIIKIDLFFVGFVSQ